MIFCVFMKATKESIKGLTNGLEPFQIDGIPEGFSFKYPSYIINGIEVGNYFIAFIPLTEVSSVVAQTEKELLDLYNKSIKKRDGKRN